MSLTLGLTGMDPATEAALKAAFVEANARLGGRWALVPDVEAEHVVVDMDSMYGPMSWLRLHAAGRHVIGLTSAPRTQTDYRLGRPFDVDQVAALLADVASGSGIELKPEPAAGATAPTVPEPAPAVPEPAPAEAVAPEPVAATVDEPTTESEAESEAESVATPAAGAVTAPPAAPTPGPQDPAPEPVPAAVASPAPASAPVPALATRLGPGPAGAGRDLAEWLRPGALSGRVRYRAADGTVLLLDPAAEAWHGPSSLKTAAACFQDSIPPDGFEALDAEAWAREAAAAGPAQPLSRLRWLGGLLAGRGELLPGLDPQGRYQLNKWPQTEREYPRHFRIATQMMKGPGTIAEIAEASGVPAADVADFINANLATGFAEPAVEAPPAADDAPRARGGLLGRLRGR